MRLYFLINRGSQWIQRANIIYILYILYYNKWRKIYFYLNLNVLVKTNQNVKSIKIECYRIADVIVHTRNTFIRKAKKAFQVLYRNSLFIVASLNFVLHSNTCMFVSLTQASFY